MSRKLKTLTQAEYQALSIGLPKYCPTAVFTIAGQSYTTPQVVALITSLLNVTVAVAPAKAAYAEARSAILAAEATDGMTVKGVREVVALMFENASTTLADFAIVPRKLPKPLSTAARAAATAKADATRKARGTSSKKQKALISGNVTGVNIIPVTSPSAAQAAPAPAATTGGSTPTVTAPALAAGSSTPHA
jgi:hypothetical protein